MTTPAKAIAHRVYDLLQDLTAVRWKVDEIVRWMNDGQRAIQQQRPDATTTTQSVVLAAGVRQNLKTLAFTKPLSKLIDVTRNTAANSRQRPITKVSRTLLEAWLPTWYGASSSVDIQHYAFDLRDSDIIVVYPPAPAVEDGDLAEVEVIYSAHPTDIAEPTGGGPFTWDSIVGNIDVSDDFQLPLIDYVLFRAYSKNSESGDKNLAASYFGAFQAGLGADLQAAATVQPTATEKA